MTIVLLTFFVAGTSGKNFFPQDVSVTNEKAVLAASRKIYGEQFLNADSLVAEKRFQALIAEAEDTRSSVVKAGLLGIAADFLLKKDFVLNPAFSYETLTTDSAQVIHYYEEALKLNDPKKYPLLNAYFQYRIGNALYKYGNFQKGVSFLFAANAALEDIGVDQLPDPGAYLLCIGSTYCDYHDCEKGLYYLHAAQKYTSSDPKFVYELNGNFGLAYFKQRQYDSSIFYSQKALAAAYAMKDTAEVGSVNGNIGAAYFELKEYKKALEHLRQDYQISSSRSSWASACGSMFFIAQVYDQLGDITSAQRCLDTMQHLFETYNCNTNNGFFSFYALRTKLYRETENYEKALVMNDSFLKYSDLLLRDKTSAMLKEAEFKTARDLAETKMRLAEDQRKRQVLFRNAIIIVAILVIVIIAQYLYRLRQKQKAERALLTAELKNAEKQLAIYIESLREKTKLLEQLDLQITESDEALATQENDGPEKQEALNRIKNVVLITDEAWKEFTGLVNLVHKDFLSNLKVKYPNLTPGDIRLLTLVKLDFSRQEMAATLGISPDSVKKARQRVRKKLDIDEATDIKMVISSV
ncbi:hypothetical protein DN068_06790 [Taibaiella soli]|uniref:Uncharacterized protein n=1 Tax=Taibaiella soli TaxID=1649169 RepID=A0A2W2BCV5_9BACT|nr:hypothetical protein DN068_06790 [Taibaiella soli]